MGTSNKLTGREYKLLDLISRGYSNQEIVNFFQITENTKITPNYIEQLIVKLYQKLGVIECSTPAAKRARAVREGFIQGLLKLDK